MFLNVAAASAACLPGRFSVLQTTVPAFTANGISFAHCDVSNGVAVYANTSHLPSLPSGPVDDPSRA